MFIARHLQQEERGELHKGFLLTGQGGTRQTLVLTQPILHDTAPVGNVTVGLTDCEGARLTSCLRWQQPAPSRKSPHARVDTGVPPQKAAA